MNLLEQAGNVWRVKELRTKILITLALLALCRVGVFIPLPGVAVREDFVAEGLGGMLDLFSGGALSKGSIFGLGVMPYISASIIFTLLAQVIPSLEQLKKEGHAGQRKLNQYTRIATVFLCFFQGALITQVILGFRLVPGSDEWGTLGRIGFAVRSGFILMAGTMFLMWIGEQIDEHGIGNGISLIITVGILSRAPLAFGNAATALARRPPQTQVLIVGAMVVLFVAVVAAVVFVTRGERRIPVQQQKHVRGPRVYGGQKHYLPLRVNQAGVMPIIFGSALLMFPNMIASAYREGNSSEAFFYGFFTWMQDALSPGAELTFSYALIYGSLIFFFCYFWTAVTFNPQEMSENLQDYGSFIPGIRPGPRTADYLEGIMTRVTLAGSFFLVVIALLPNVLYSIPPFSDIGGGGITSFFGGTSILIAVGVTLDLVRRINDHLEMRRYAGFGAGSGGRRRSRSRRR
jgi:preprotein translocase subunit SecY